MKHSVRPMVSRFSLPLELRLFSHSSLLLVCIASVLFVGSSSFAQQAKSEEIKPSEEAAVVEELVNRAHFENDGTGFYESKAVVHVQSQAGVEQYGQLVFGYSSATEKLDVVYARVRKANGQVIETPHNNEQDLVPDTLDSAPMYSDYRERHVTVVNLRAGDTLEYATKTTIATPLAAGQFWYEFTFPKYRVVKVARLLIDVPKSREVKLKSPKRKYATAEDGDWRTYTWEVKDITPDRRARTMEEVENEEQQQEDSGPEVQLTTFADWKAVAAWYAKLQGERVVVDAAMKQKAAELTRGATTPDEKARRLYDFVARDFRYVSLSFGVGRLQPHAATEVLQAGYGDCKDKHTLLAALLQAVNIPSYPVLIGFGRKLDTDVPSPAQFNHVITAVPMGKDKDLTWLDTTAEVAPYGLIMLPLRDKEAVLVSGGENGGLVRTPVDSPVKNRMSYTIEGKVSPTGTLDATVDILARGDYEIPYRAAFRSISQADWQRYLKITLEDRGTNEISDVKVESLEDTTKPVHVHFRMRQERSFVVPNSGSDYYPFLPLPLPTIRKPERGAKIVRVGPTGELTQELKLTFPQNFKVRVPSTVALARDYGEYHADFDYTNGVLTAKRKLVLKVNELPIMRRSDAEALRSLALNTSAQTISWSANAVAKGATNVAEKGTQSPEEMRSAGIKALQQRDYKTAAQLLKQAAEAGQPDKAPWYELGRAYAALNAHDDAVSAFRKQIELNQGQKNVYDELAAELQALGKNDDAVNAYKKQLENQPLDKTAHRRLGLLLAQMKHDGDAIAELEAFNAVPPGDPQVSYTLAKLYARTGKADASRKMMGELMGVTSVSAGGDPFSNALRADINADDTLRDAGDVLSQIGDQFESASYSTDLRAAAAAMPFVGLEWARIGWAHSVKGETMDAIRYLKASLDLTMSPVVANRLAQVYENAGNSTNAKGLYALAIALGGAEAEDSSTRLKRLTPNVDEAVKKATAELSAMREVKVGKAGATASADTLDLVFDGSQKPERVDSHGVDLSSAEQMVLNASYPVTFPEVSSLKVVRQGALKCQQAGCVVGLKPAAFERSEN